MANLACFSVLHLKRCRQRTAASTRKRAWSFSSASDLTNEQLETQSPTTRSLPISLLSLTRYCLFSVFDFVQIEMEEMNFRFWSQILVNLVNFMVYFQANVTDGCSRTVGNLLYTVMQFSWFFFNVNFLRIWSSKSCYSVTSQLNFYNFFWLKVVPVLTGCDEVPIEFPGASPDLARICCFVKGCYTNHLEVGS